MISGVAVKSAEGAASAASAEGVAIANGRAVRVGASAMMNTDGGAASPVRDNVHAPSTVTVTPKRGSASMRNREELRIKNVYSMAG